jgi:hypothetical protein
MGSTGHVRSHHLSAFGVAALAGFHRAMLTCAIIDFAAVCRPNTRLSG